MGKEGTLLMAIKLLERSLYCPPIKLQSKKFIIAIVSGMLCLFGSFYSLRFAFSTIEIKIVWSLVFPMLVTLAWGYQYGIISLTLGLAFLYPFFIWPSNGWANIVTVATSFLWILFQGYASGKREAEKKVYNLYFIQIIYTVIPLLLYTTVYPFIYKFNPPFWNKAALTAISSELVTIITIKVILNEFLIIAICDVFLLIPFIRKLLMLPKGNISKYNSRIILSFAVSGALAVIVAMTVDHYLINKDKSFRWLINGDNTFIFSLFMAIGYCTIAGGATARYFQRKLEAEEKSKTNEEKYREIFENINDIFYEATLEGEITNISPSIKAVLGYEPEEVIGRRIGDLHYKTKENDVLKAVLEYKEIGNYEIELKHKKGHKCFIWLHAKIVNRQDGERIIGIARDVTNYIDSRKKHSESEKKNVLLNNSMNKISRQLDCIVESTDDLIWSVDIKHNLVIFNSAASKYFKLNYGVDLVPGIKTDDMFTIGYAKMWISYYDRALKEGKYQLQLKSPSNGRYFDISIHLIYKDEEVIEFAVFGKDITERKIAEEKVYNLNTELEQRVIERTGELEAAVKGLETFSYTVSHDLKSPLRAIDSYINILLEDYSEKFQGEPEEMLLSVRNISKEMIVLVNKLLQYSTTDKLRLFKEEIDINEMFLTAFEELSSTIPDRTVRLEITDKLPKVRADRILIKQVIYNILSNALKFTRDRQETLIKLGCNAEDKEYVFYVSDNGVGFDMEYASKLFGAFERLHSSDEFEGTGIGLATIRKVIQKHNGRTWIEGKLNKGATVYFSLPIDEM